MSENESRTYPNPLGKMAATVRDRFTALKKQELKRKAHNQNNWRKLILIL